MGQKVFIHGVNKKGVRGASLKKSGTENERVIPKISVKGHISNSINDAAGNLTITGWACQEQTERSLIVKLLVGEVGKSESFSILGETTANLPSEEKVSTSCKANYRNYRFKFNIPQSIAKEHEGKRIFIEAVPYSPELLNNNLKNAGMFVIWPSRGGKISITKSKIKIKNYYLKDEEYHLIPDHSNKSIKGSIAWHMSRKEFENPKKLSYELTRGEVYIVKNKLTLPDGVVLTSSAENSSEIERPTIKAHKSFPINQSLLTLKSNSRLDKLIIDGSFRTKQVIDFESETLGEKSRLMLTNSNIHSSINHVVGLKRSRNILIQKCILSEAGISRHDFNTNKTQETLKVPEKRWSNVINGASTYNLQIVDNIIEYSLGANIAVPRSKFAYIRGNKLSASGYLGELLDHNGGQDGIIAYNNEGQLENIFIDSNTITKYHNNGMHISGKGITVSRNTIVDGRAFSIHIGSHKKGSNGIDDPSNNVLVVGNIIDFPLDMLKDVERKKGLTLLSDKKEVCPFWSSPECKVISYTGAMMIKYLEEGSIPFVQHNKTCTKSEALDCHAGSQQNEPAISYKNVCSYWDSFLQENYNSPRIKACSIPNILSKE